MVSKQRIRQTARGVVAEVQDIAPLTTRDILINAALAVVLVGLVAVHLKVVARQAVAATVSRLSSSRRHSVTRRAARAARARPLDRWTGDHLLVHLGRAARRPSGVSHVPPFPLFAIIGVRWRAAANAIAAAEGACTHNDRDRGLALLRVRRALVGLTWNSWLPFLLLLSSVRLVRGRRSPQSRRRRRVHAIDVGVVRCPRHKRRAQVLINCARCAAFNTPLRGKTLGPEYAAAAGAAAPRRRDQWAFVRHPRPPSAACWFYGCRATDRNHQPPSRAARPVRLP